MHKADTLEQCAIRLTNTLARKPRSAKTRAYLATLPKRPKLIVTPADFSPSRAEARESAALQAMRDALSYADWEARGKPPSPSAPRKDRVRPRARLVGELPMRQRLYDAQRGNCGLCGLPIHYAAEGTFDHVVPRARGGGNVGNLLLAHADCNNKKADRPPTAEELETLAMVNARLTPTIQERTNA